MKALFALIVLLSLIDAQACEINLPERLLLSGSQGEQWPFGAKNCSHDQLSSFHDLIAGQSGPVSVRRLQAVTGKSSKLVAPSDMVSVQRLDQLIHDSYPQTTERDMSLTNAIEGDMISIPNDGEVRVRCHPCLFSGDETIRVEVRSFASTRKDYTFTAHFRQLVLAPKARATISAFSIPTAGQFEMVTVPQTGFSKYITDVSRLNYYKLNKTIRAGEILRESDLTPLSLVRAGDRVELLLQTGTLELKSHATSRQSGGIGESIEVWNQATGRKYRGVITDQNKVTVEL